MAARGGDGSHLGRCGEPAHQRQQSRENESCGDELPYGDITMDGVSQEEDVCYENKGEGDHHRNEAQAKFFPKVV